MAQDPAFLMYYKDWIVSTAGWDADVRGWYINLLCQQADKGALSDDLETLAELAGVKISQFDRFKQCWEQTLKHKFKPSADSGAIANQKLDRILNGRKEYSSVQAKRGLIGYYIKTTRKICAITEDQATELYKRLDAYDLINMDKLAQSDCLKHTLLAYIGIVDANANAIVNAIVNSKNKGGAHSPPKTEPPKLWNTRPNSEDYDLVLPEVKAGAVQQQFFYTSKTEATLEQVHGLWDVFKKQNFTGEKYYQTENDAFSHFINWSKNQKLNGSHRTTPSRNSKSAGASALLEDFKSDLADTARRKKSN